MSEAFHLGGWGMYPTLIAGVLLVGAAARYAWQADRQRMILVIWMQVLTMLVGTLGFVAGMIKTAISAGDTASPGATVIQGFGESLHNVGLALCLVITASIVVALGMVRRKRGAGTDGTPVDPFA